MPGVANPLLSMRSKRWFHAIVVPKDGQGPVVPHAPPCATARARRSLQSGLAARLVAAATVLPFGGCSIDGLGLVRTDVIEADGAMVVHTRTYGVDLRTRAAEAGVTIGYTSTLRVTPRGQDAPAAGRYRFGLSTRALPTTAIVRRVAGIDIGVNPSMIGVMLGFSEDAVFTRIPAGTTIVRRLVLFPNDPARTVLRLCEEAAGCE